MRQNRTLGKSNLQKPRWQTRHKIPLRVNPHVHIAAAKRDMNDPGSPRESPYKLRAYMAIEEAEIERKYRAPLLEELEC